MWGSMKFSRLILAASFLSPLPPLSPLLSYFISLHTSEGYGTGSVPAMSTVCLSSFTLTFTLSLAHASLILYICPHSFASSLHPSITPWWDNVSSLMRLWLALDLKCTMHTSVSCTMPCSCTICYKYIIFVLSSCSCEQISSYLAVMHPRSPTHTDFCSSLSYLFKCVGAVIAIKIVDTIERAHTCTDCGVG